MKKNKYSYTIHNLIAHPLMEILHLMGMTELGNKIHDYTLPKQHAKENKQTSSELE